MVKNERNDAAGMRFSFREVNPAECTNKTTAREPDVGWDKRQRRPTNLSDAVGLRSAGPTLRIHKPANRRDADGKTEVFRANGPTV